MTKPTLSPRQWGEIQKPKKSKSRVHQLIKKTRIPGVTVVLEPTKDGGWKSVTKIPADAVCEVEPRNPIPAPGYMSLLAWSKKKGCKRSTALNHFHLGLIEGSRVREVVNRFGKTRIINEVPKGAKVPKPKRGPKKKEQTKQPRKGAEKRER